MTEAYYVESVVYGSDGSETPCHICVATEARAKELVSLKPGATWRKVTNIRDDERTALDRAAGRLV